MKISVCMIVKDEEEVIARCLISVVEFADEIVVVDTGSTDGTVELCAGFGAKVCHLEWTGDFSAARNFSLQKATGDWILVLDADEYIAEGLGAVIKQFAQKETIAGKVELLSEFNNNGQVTWESSFITRFFRNNEGYHYRGIIHEQVYKNDKLAEGKPMGVKVYHTGYAPELVKDKVTRNLSLLSEEVKSNPNDAYVRYQLGKTYFCAKNWSGAAEEFAKSLEFIDPFEDYYINLIIDYGYALKELRRPEQALELLKQHQILNKSPDYCFLQGLLWLDIGDPEPARTAFESCLDTYTRGRFREIVAGVASFMAAYNLGVIYELTGKLETALEYYVFALRQKNDYKPVIKRLFMLQVENSIQIEDFIEIVNLQVYYECLPLILDDYIAEGQPDELQKAVNLAVVFDKPRACKVIGGFFIARGFTEEGERFLHEGSGL